MDFDVTYMFHCVCVLIWPIILTEGLEHTFNSARPAFRPGRFYLLTL